MRDILAFQGMHCARVTDLRPARGAAPPSDSPRDRALGLAAIIDLAIAAGIVDPSEVLTLARECAPA